MRSHNRESSFMKMSIFLATIFMMVMSNSAEDCPNGWTCTGHSCFCLFITSGVRTIQNEAKKTCENIGATLPMPKTQSLEAAIVSSLADGRNNPVTGIWLGLEKGDDGQVLWADGEELDSSYTNWGPVHQAGDCNALIFSHIKNETFWAGGPCNGGSDTILCERTAVIPICERPNAVVVDNECISLETEPETWEQAKAACEAKGPSVTLTSLLSPVVREYIQEQTKTLAKRVWLGGTDGANENTWVWTATGEVADIDPTWWGQGQPDNWKGNEDCLLIRPDGKLNDANCDWKFPYFCSSRNGLVAR